MDIGNVFSKDLKYLNGLASVITVLTIIGGAYYWYRTTIWRPKLKVSKVDWVNGIATVEKGNTTYTLYRNQILSVGGDFGIKFSGDTDETINRIELYKNYLIYEVLAKKS